MRNSRSNLRRLAVIPFAVAPFALFALLGALLVTNSVQASSADSLGRVVTHSVSYDAKVLLGASRLDRHVQPVRQRFERIVARRQVVTTVGGLLNLIYAGLAGAFIVGAILLSHGYRDRSLLLSRAPPVAPPFCV